MLKYIFGKSRFLHTL